MRKRFIVGQGACHHEKMDEKRKRFLIAKALWEFVASDQDKPKERQSRSDVDDMEAILDADFPGEVATLMRLETYKDRS
ncbi:hypothetical protein So717_43190 [Roseobacter cerasinus]|uniref:Uncharacterized protein n=1 Tax=Roseobacter cerasinus TaxID=2602289 RepID=A0A640W246_9RHOB|nr:hypothetical protein [Roseobacter cerasinus]GFE52566.1 hypothetical protein So717_43190 [Roseobacter cerasinus]